MEQPTTIGLDLAKSVFQVHGVDADGGTRVKRKLRRAQVLAFFAGLEPCRVGMEACAGRISGRASFKRSGTTFASCRLPT